MRSSSPSSVLAWLAWFPFKLCALAAKLHTLEWKTRKIGYVERFFQKNKIDYRTITAETSDGYFISLQHLTPPTGTPSRGAVLFIHGMFESSAMSLTHAMDSLPLLLQRKGYHVFLGNGRGNMYGLKHRTMSPWSEAFWDFDMKSHAKSDFPAMVSAALSESGGHSTVTCYGTSQGALVALMGLSLTPSLNKKVNLVCAISPALVLQTPSNPLVSTVFKTDPSLLGSPQYFMFASFVQIFVPDWMANLGAFFALRMSGMSLLPMDKDGAWEVMASTPSGFLPTRSMRMYQDILSKGVDFFKKGGACDFEKIECKIGLWMGSEDVVLNLRESEKLLEGLGKAKVVKKVVLEGWGHTDLWYSLKSKERLTPDVMKLIDQVHGV